MTPAAKSTSKGKASRSKAKTSSPSKARSSRKKAPAAAALGTFWCSGCGAEAPADVAIVACECGRPMSPRLPTFDPAEIVDDDRSVWRYQRMLPLTTSKKHPPLTLGEGGTPLIEMSLVGMPVHFKLEFLQPTGSYKDRGAAVLTTALSMKSPRLVVEDSSGNAGASMAAYLSRANIGLQLYVPGVATSGAMRQAQAHGAEIDQSAATRDEAAELAREAVSKTQHYASHVFSPFFMAGVTTMAYELWEQLGDAPHNMVLPVGQGVLALGLHYGFRALKEAGLVKRQPKIFGVQARSCPPVANAFNRGAEETTRVAAHSTEAYGVAVADPPRGAEILAALREAKGSMLTVSESELRRGQALMANAGWYVEPTAAVAVAGVVKLDKQIGSRDITVVPLTGTGIKV